MALSEKPARRNDSAVASSDRSPPLSVGYSNNQVTRIRSLA